MQHLAVRSDRLLPIWAKDKYVLKLEMQCPVCGSVSYQLWSPILEKEKSSTVNQMRWLTAYLEKNLHSRREHSSRLVFNTRQLQFCSGLNFWGVFAVFRRTT